MTSRTISASRDASKDGSGDLQALPPNPILPSFNISFFFFFNLHGTCGFPDSCSFRCFERNVCLSSGGSFSLTAPQPPSISSWPSFPGGRILASLLLGRKALTQPFENSQNHMVFEDCIQFYAGCLATWLALNPLISS